MGNPNLAKTGIEVKDMERATKSYDAFRGLKAKNRYEHRWTGVKAWFGFSEPSFDVVHDISIRDFALGRWKW